ncbi:hypothetical protein evm_010233 [Chilo suppressalis]|nr:hypothetical protein evm_010233 [Chilo suppressalis]
MTTKRERGINFKRDESDTLIQLVNENKHVLENKKSDAVTWAEKEQCWQRIETKFNSLSSVRFRSAKALKIKYDGLKRDTRKKSAAIRAETYRTGGGPSTAPILTPSEEKVKDMILLSVEGMNSLFDSDQIPAIESSELKMIPVVHHDSIIVEANEKPDETLVVHREPKKVMSSNTFISNVSSDNEPKRKISKLIHSEDADTAEWSQWKPTSLRAKKHPALCKQKPKRPFEKLAESKLEIAAIQKQILEEELQNKRKQWLFEEEEREHKRVMWALEKQQL